MDSYRTVVHDEIARWHLDDARVPKLFPLADSRWQRYEDRDLYKWEEPREVSEVGEGVVAWGHMGVPVKLPKEMEREAKEKSAKHSLNVVASDLISVNRSLPDYRNSKCQSKGYPDHLPRATIIVIFHNEPRSTLLRTVHSVINRSPRSLLREIILVDDDSDIADLLSSLDTYVRGLPVPTRVLRTGSRLGLIRARLAGANAAAAASASSSSNGVLVFLDAHIEVTGGWLTPLLSEITGDRTRVLLPVIDELDHRSFEYMPVEDDHERGGLEWKMFHSWIGPRTEGMIAGQEDTDAVASPTMIGCAFAVDREFFFAVGGYDDRMKIWGGENVEQSVRVWRCGGSVLVHPCSRVGHLYRKTTPHHIPGGYKAKMEVANVNTARFVEVWMDEDYRKFYYYINPGSRSLEIGDISDRQKLVEDLQCHSFQWFLDHVYPDSSFPNGHIYMGQIQESNSKLCLDAMSRKDLAGLRLCHGLGGFQTILYTNRHELRSSFKCLGPDIFVEDIGKLDGKLYNVSFETCDGTKEQKWSFEVGVGGGGGGKLVNHATGLCLTVKSRKEEAEEKEKKDGGGDHKRPKMILEYLSNIVKDITKSEVATPSMEECEGDGGGVGQVWMMNAEADWRSGKWKTYADQREKRLEDVMFQEHSDSNDL